jgi:hypothetical protein
MSTLKSFISLFILSLLILIGSGNICAQTKLRIGTYDSRIIAIAYFGSKHFTRFAEQTERMKTAKEKYDTAEIANINKEMSLRQRMMHEQGFGKGTVCYLMDEIKDKISEFAKNEKLNIIVSKWELNYYGTNVEIIDVTEKVANLFEPSKSLKDIIPEMEKNSPVKDAFLIEDD